MPEITHLLFDCDNTLVLSEDLAFEACADVANEILSKRNISHRYTGEQLIQDFVGQNFRGMMISLQAKFGFEMSQEELEHYVKEEENQVIAKLEAKAEPCDGVMDELDALQESGKYDMAVVSSSALRRVKASLKKVGQAQYFPPDDIFSAATSLPKPTSKPDPAIYLFALERLGKNADECIAIEDSKSGALSAIRAGIHVVGYVGSYHGEEKRQEMTQLLTDLGAEVVMTHWSEFPDCLKEVEES
ncbi:HAD-like domain containing protein [Elaphomyces granulatus]